MTEASLSKRLARATRNWRVTFGLAREAEPTSAVLARSRARRALPGGRLHALEADLTHFVAAWNQHIPQVLSEIGEARRATAEGRAARQEIARLEARLEEVSQTLSQVLQRLDAVPAPTGVRPAAKPSTPRKTGQGRPA